MSNFNYKGKEIRRSPLVITGSSATTFLKVEQAASGSTAILTNNITNGYPTSNPWGENLEGSYFNNFDNSSNVSEILRFMSGVLSHSLDVADASPNTLTFASVDTVENSLGTTDDVDGYLPQSYNDSNATMKYLVTKQWVDEGAQIFSGIDVYHDNGTSYKIDFDSNNTGTGTVSSSADSELFGLGGLTGGAETEFSVRVSATQSFSDTGSIANPSSSNTFTTQSSLELSTSTFGTTDGLTLAKINTSQPAVIPAAFQDGKFVDVGGTSLTGSLTRKYGTSGTDFTSVSASGYYNFHGLKIGVATGSTGLFTFIDGTSKNNFWAPIDQISTDIGTNSLGITAVTQSYLTATSRSLSGAPYLIGATYHISASVHGLFDPLYRASSTIADDTIGSVSAGSIVGSGTDDVSTSGGTVQTANAIYAGSGSSAAVRATGVVPTRTDIYKHNATYTLSGTTSENINETGFGDTSYTVGVRGRNRSNSRSTLQTETIFYHTASSFGQPQTSGSLGMYQRAQGFDGGALTGTTETFTGEDFRIQLNNNVVSFNGDAFTTTYTVVRDSNRVLGEQDLQVKPGFLVNPSGTYRYWYPNNYGTGSFKYYIRRFQTSGTKSSMTLNLNSTTLVNWKAVTDDSVAAAVLFKSSASGSGVNDELARARIYDPSETTANSISSSVVHQTDFHLNPFSDAIDLYGNTGGSVSSDTYTMPLRNADGMYLDSSDNELYVIVRYSGDPTPIDDITLTFS